MLVKNSHSLLCTPGEEYPRRSIISAWGAEDYQIYFAHPVTGALQKKGKPGSSTNISTSLLNK
jgi:hypothetical protein